MDFDLNRAFRLLAHGDEATLVAAVRAYRQQVLAGTAAYGSPATLKVLFPSDERRAKGTWPTAVLAWVRAQGITGSGATRLRRVYEAVIAAGERHTMDGEGDYLRLWPTKQVLAVLAGKGGVGKCLAGQTGDTWIPERASFTQNSAGGGEPQPTPRSDLAGAIADWNRPDQRQDLLWDGTLYSCHAGIRPFYYGYAKPSLPHALWMARGRTPCHRCDHRFACAAPGTPRTKPPPRRGGRYFGDLVGGRKLYGPTVRFVPPTQRS